MNWIKDKLIDYQLKKALSKLQEREIGMPKKPKTAGIFASNQEEFEEAKKLIRDKWGFQIRIEGGFYADTHDTVESISPQQFSFWGLPSDYFNSLLEEKLDFILVPSLNLNAYLRYLLLLNPSGFKMGFLSEENSPYLDLMIKKEGEDLRTNLEKLLKYFGKIKTTC
jgi:hypothetical protein